MSDQEDGIIMLPADPQDDGLSDEAEDLPAGDLVLAADLLPDLLIILPNIRRPVFPGMFLPVTVTERTMASFKLAMERHHGHLGLLCTRETEWKKGFTFNDMYDVGAVAKVVRSLPLPDGKLQVIIHVVKRLRVVEQTAESPVLVARVTYLEDEYPPRTNEFRAATLAVVDETRALIGESPSYGDELKLIIDRFSAEQAGMLADFTAALTGDSSREELQDILETLDVEARLHKTLILLKRERQVVGLRNKISRQIEERISEGQREFFLKEQLKEIKKELGLEEDPAEQQRKEYSRRMSERKIPPDVQKVIDEELAKLLTMDTRSPEYNVLRNYLDWLTLLPWGIYSREHVSLKKARRILERDHYGMEDVKDRILEFIAVRAIKPDAKGGIVCLVGPPGVGKTSIGKAVAEALGRKFYRFSVGGMRDEAEIKGHRRTYVGALPGKIIQALKRVGSSSPVLMIDEIDKLAMGMQGDPAAALLEVLDPEQNVSFLDHYLDVPFDLSDVLFVCTANQLDTIPQPLLDRMEVIRLAGYLDVEKVEIARRFLVPRERAQNGLNVEDFEIGRGALAQVVESYAREAGVRRLDQALARLCRKAARMKAEGHVGKIRITRSNLEHFLGKPILDNEEVGGVARPGVVRGLAYTAMGGATLTIEVAALPIEGGQGSVKLTGQMGDVMKESVGIAVSWVAAHVGECGADPRFFQRHNIHVHIPAGATPKDGPSAGIALATALMSLASGRIFRAGLAMTGELSLTGRVLPVGGIREKCMAARRVGVEEIILPARNRRDVGELPQRLRDQLRFWFVEEMSEVWRIGLGPQPMDPLRPMAGSDDKIPMAVPPAPVA